jgi:hypothetical protein
MDLTGNLTRDAAALSNEPHNTSGTTNIARNIPNQIFCIFVIGFFLNFLQIKPPKGRLGGRLLIIILF